MIGAMPRSRKKLNGQITIMNREALGECDGWGHKSNTGEDGIAFLEIRQFVSGLLRLQPRAAVFMSDNWRCMRAGEIAIAIDMIPVGMTIDAQKLALCQFCLERLQHHRDIIREKHRIKNNHVAAGDDSISIDLKPSQLFERGETATKNTHPGIRTHLRNK